MDNSRGIIFIAYGQRAAEILRPLNLLEKSAIWGLPMLVVYMHTPIEGLRPLEVPFTESMGYMLAGLADPPLGRARLAKLLLFDASPFQYTLYLDADTVPYQDPSVIFDILDDGYDLVIAPSQAQGESTFWHIDPVEIAATLPDLGIVPVQLQCGVLGFSKNERVKEFFEAWLAEWMKYKAHDQAALLRALWRVPLRIHLLGRPFNGGPAIGHRHGLLRT